MDDLRIFTSVLVGHSLTRVCQKVKRDKKEGNLHKTETCQTVLLYKSWCCLQSDLDFRACFANTCCCQFVKPHCRFLCLHFPVSSIFRKRNLSFAHIEPFVAWVSHCLGCYFFLLQCVKSSTVWLQQVVSNDILLISAQL